MKTRMTVRIALATLLVAITACIPVAAQQLRYRVVDLGTFGGPGSGLNIPDAYTQILNNSGTVVGAADTATAITFPNGDPGFTHHAFQWRKGSMVDLGTLAADDSSEANWVSASGLIAGISIRNQPDPLRPTLPLFHAVLWKDGEIVRLGALDGWHQSLAFSANNRGQVVGAAMNSVPDEFSMFGEGYQSRAFLWDKGVLQDLGTLGGPDAIPVAINNQGQVLGNSYTDFVPSGFCAQNLGLTLTTHAFLWQEGRMIDIGDFGGSCTFAAGLNDRGQAVGLSALTGDTTQHAFFWDRGVLKDLGTLGGDKSFAGTLNEAGTAVGFAAIPGNDIHATMWVNGSATDLGTLNDDPASSAFDINAKGQIVGITIDADGNLHSFIWQQGGALIDLNSFLPPGSDVQLELPGTINDNGEIAIVGRLGTGDEHAFMLIPCTPNEAGCIAASQNAISRRATLGLSSKTKIDPQKKLMELWRARSNVRRFFQHSSVPALPPPDSNPKTTEVAQANTLAESATAPTTTTAAETCSIVSQYSICVYEPAAGYTQNSPVHVRVAAGSYFHYGYVYIDGVLRSSAYANSDAYLTTTLGEHTLRVCVAHDFWGRQSRPACVGPTSFTVNSIGSCSAPTSAGVHVCSPSGSTGISSPIRALATGAVTGTFARMELWVDGVKKLNSTHKTIDSHITIGAGTHRLNFRVVNTAGAFWDKAVYASVK